MDSSHYYRQIWYWGGEAKLRVEGKKMELTTIPANEWELTDPYNQPSVNKVDNFSTKKLTKLKIHD